VIEKVELELLFTSLTILTLLSQDPFSEFKEKSELHGVISILSKMKTTDYNKKYKSYCEEHLFHITIFPKVT